MRWTKILNNLLGSASMALQISMNSSTSTRRSPPSYLATNDWTDLSSLPDQSARAQCHDRGRARRRGRQGIRGRSRRGEGARLADSTATEEISGQIRAIQDITRDAVAAIERIGATISKISEISTAVSSAVEQQDATTREMAHNVTTVAQSTSVVSEKVAGLANAAGETGQAADMVRDHAGELKHQADALRIQVDQFLTRVRAA